MTKGSWHFQFGLTLVILLIDQPVLCDIFLLVLIKLLFNAIHSVLEFTMGREIRVSSETKYFLFLMREQRLRKIDFSEDKL